MIRMTEDFAETPERMRQIFENIWGRSFSEGLDISGNRSRIIDEIKNSQLYQKFL